MFERRYTLLLAVSWILRGLGTLVFLFAVFNFFRILLTGMGSTDAPYWLGVYGGLSISSLLVFALGELMQLAVDVADHILG